MADYETVSVNEIDVRNFVTPHLDYDDVSKAEILLKIESVETYVSRVFFDGGTIPDDGRIAVLLLIMPQLLATPTLARKYRTLASETFRDYSYVISQPMSTGKQMQSDPFAITKTWHQMGLEILRSLAGDDKYTLYKVNE
jgi:hypothetical protein